MRLHCFHGFLGSPREFDFLKSESIGAEVVAYDMAKLCSGSKEEALASLDIRPEDALIGYSFGARFALEAAQVCRPLRLIMFAGHAGLGGGEEELAARETVESAFIQKIQELDFEDFVAYWNSLPLFEHDEPISPAPMAKDILINMFKEFGLSKQGDGRPWLEREAKRVTWVVGKLDRKYLEHVKGEVEPLGVDCRYVEAGHRLLQKEAIALSIVKEVLGQL